MSPARGCADRKCHLVPCHRRVSDDRPSPSTRPRRQCPEFDALNPGPHRPHAASVGVTPPSTLAAAWCTPSPFRPSHGGDRSTPTAHEVSSRALLDGRSSPALRADSRRNFAQLRVSAHSSAFCRARGRRKTLGLIPRHQLPTGSTRCAAHRRSMLPSAAEATRRARRGHRVHGLHGQATSPSLVVP